MAEKATPISLYPGPWLAAVQDRAKIRHSRSAAVSAMLLRYAWICERSIPAWLREPDNQCVVNMLRDVCTGMWVSWLGPGNYRGAIELTGQGLALLLFDGCKDSQLHTKWGLPEERIGEVCERLAALSLAESIAVVDAIERWWGAGAGAGPADPIAGPFAAADPAGGPGRPPIED